MKIATTTGDFIRFCKTDIERLDELHLAGFRYVDLNMYSFKPDSVYMQDGWENEVKKLKEHADSLGMTFVQAHSQGGNPLSDDKEYTDFLMRATLRSFEICAMLGIPSTVVHSGTAEGISKEEWFAKNKVFFEGEPNSNYEKALFENYKRLKNIKRSSKISSLK